MKIAILVHNTIVGDARVRKEARSLSDVGYDVDLFGYGDLTNAPNNLENCNLILVKKIAINQLVWISKKSLRKN